MNFDVAVPDKRPSRNQKRGFRYDLAKKQTDGNGSRTLQPLMTPSLGSILKAKFTPIWKQQRKNKPITIFVSGLCNSSAFASDSDTHLVFAGS